MHIVDAKQHETAVETAQSVRKMPPLRAKCAQNTPVFPRKMQRKIFLEVIFFINLCVFTLTFLYAKRWYCEMLF